MSRYLVFFFQWVVISAIGLGVLFGKNGADDSFEASSLFFILPM